MNFIEIIILMTMGRKNIEYIGLNEVIRRAKENVISS